MRTSIRAVVGILAVVVLAGCAREEPPKRTPPPDAKRVDTAKAGHVSGRVTVEGPVPENAAIKMSGDPACERANPGARFDTYVTEDGGLGNVFVYVKEGLAGYFFDTPSNPVVLDQKGCQYAPHVFGVQVGQRIQFVNGDQTAHNVHSLPNVNSEFNFMQHIQNQKDTRFFTKPEVMVRFKCDVHSWMSAYAGVLEHPYFAVSVPTGQFELKNLPAGAYTIEAWHEKLGTLTENVTLAENETRALTFTFKAPPTTSP